MKYALILGIVALVLFLVYWRLRPYLRAARHVLGVLREARRMSAGAARPDEPPRAGPAAAGGKLARCAACGTWLPASRAVSLRSGATYCSHACLERAAEPAGDRRKSAL